MGWLRGVDLNHRPLGYEPNELPDCSTPRSHNNNRQKEGQTPFHSAHPDPVRAHPTPQDGGSAVTEWRAASAALAFGKGR